MSAMPPKAEVISGNAIGHGGVDGTARDVFQAPNRRFMRYELSDYEWAATINGGIGTAVTRADRCSRAAQAQKRDPKCQRGDP
jgi:hypothetical protein